MDERKDAPPGRPVAMEPPGMPGTPRVVFLNRIPPGPVTRFAPSPTGRLHLGHVVNAVWVWGLAQATGGRVLLRIEDHDRGRCRQEFEDHILADLEWLGLEPDAGTVRSLRSGPSPFRQSDGAAEYEAALARLREAQRVFACACSRKQIAAAAGVAAREGDEVPYPGTCRAKGLEAGPGRGLRLVLPDVPIAFEDLRHGRLTQHPARQCGDLLLRDPTGNWTYQFCVVVDDLRHGVTLVIRGDDLLASTGRQLQLRGMLSDAPPPVHLHHPLVFGATPGVKLSKRDQVAGLDAMRAAGRSAASVLGEAAFRSGLLPAPGAVAAGELGGLFA